MKVTGFSFIKDAVKYDYPVVEAIRSILPICTNFIVAVGKSSDETLQLIKNIAPEKITILETVWDETQREGGRVLAIETDKAYHAISDDSDWCFYIQGDEVVHEKYVPVIQEAMLKYKDRHDVDGLLFDYVHFYGSYDYVATASNFYKKEIRIIRKKADFFSYRDAQGFRKRGALSSPLGEKLHVISIEAFIYHYGWVKQPKAMQAKQENFNKYWHDDAWVEKNVSIADEFDYSNISSLEKFTGTHPEVMKERIKNINWHFDYDLSYNKFSLKDKIKSLMYFLFNIDLNYRNYKEMKP